MNEEVRRLRIQIRKQQEDDYGEYDKSLNELYYDLFLEIDELLFLEEMKWSVLQ